MKGLRHRVHILARQALLAGLLLISSSRAQAAVREAQRAFESFCGNAHEPLQAMLTAEQYQIIQNASANAGLPAPYRWLDLDDAGRRAVRRAVEVHEARQRLARKYPHLEQHVASQPLAQQVEQTLSDAQKQQLARLQERDAGGATP